MLTYFFLTLLNCKLILNWKFYICYLAVETISSDCPYQVLPSPFSPESINPNLKIIKNWKEAATNTAWMFKCLFSCNIFHLMKKASLVLIKRTID